MTNLTIAQRAPLPQQPRPIVSIGGGGIVHDAHYPAYQKAGFTVAGLFDLNPERARMMADTFAIPTRYSSLMEAATQAPAEAIFDVAVPAKNILDVLQQLPNGRAVLIQKPMGDNLAQARAILALCDAKQLTAAINFQMRWAPFIIAARSLIDQGAIGEVHDMEVRVTVYTPWHLWPFLQAVPYSEILYHSIHYIDLVRSFLGEPQGIYAKTVKHPKLLTMQGSRTNMIFDYGDVLRCNVETNHHHEYGLRHQESYVKWEGTHGAIKAKLGLLMNYPTGEPDAFEYCILQQGQAPTWQEVAIAGSWFPDAFIGSMASLMRYVDGETDQLPTAVADAFRTMAVADAACRSSAGGATKIEAA
ncbi:MAG: Gfo/Idh/MocA family oxidoreductase [Caldilineaceae bacterium]